MAQQRGSAMRKELGLRGQVDAEAVASNTLPTVEESGFVSPAVPAHLSTRAFRRRASEQVRSLAVDDDPRALRYVRDNLVRSANGGRVLTCETLLRRVWGLAAAANVRPMRTTMSSIRRKLGDDTEYPAYIFTELRVGYRMPKGEGQVNGKQISNIAGQNA